MRDRKISACPIVMRERAEGGLKQRAVNPQVVADSVLTNICSGPMTMPRQNSRWWKKVTWALCLWQSLVFALAGLCHLIGSGTQAPALADSESREVASLLQPTDYNKQQSLSEVNKLFETHRMAVQLWQGAIYQILDGMDPESVLSKLEAQAPRSPKFYDNYTRWLLTDFWRKSHGELLITATGYGCVSENVLAGIDALGQEPAVEKEAARYRDDAKSLALILLANYPDAAKSMSAESTIFSEKEAKKITASLSRLKQSPSDFERRLELAESLVSFARTGRFTVGYTSYCWDLWNEASTLEQRVSVMSLLGHIYERDEDPETTRMLYSAGVRLSSSLTNIDPNLEALLITGVAKVESKAAKHLVAASLYQKAGEITQDKKLWGISAFNQGSLLRKAGYGQAAAKVLLRLIESDVNDQDPSENLTETYRNYRHRAALLIADSYRDRGNLPMLYYWRYKTAKHYPFQSWCGTCLESGRWEETTDLLLGALQAGPIFFAAHLIIFPGRNWFLWPLILFGGAWVWLRGR
jgi:tetratricopeptide (TPR) repeat protein